MTEETKYKIKFVLDKINDFNINNYLNETDSKTSNESGLNNKIDDKIFEKNSYEEKITEALFKDLFDKYQIKIGEIKQIDEKLDTKYIDEMGNYLASSLKNALNNRKCNFRLN